MCLINLFSYLRNRTIHTDNGQRSGDHRSNEGRLSLSSVEVVQQFGHDDAEHVADSADDEVGHESGSDHRPAPTAVWRQCHRRLRGSQQVLSTHEVQ